jgi:outer membrane biosynthesis protein TonB
MTDREWATVFAAIVAGCEDTDTAIDLIVALIVILRGTPPLAEDETHLEYGVELAEEEPEPPEPDPEEEDEPEDADEPESEPAQPVKRPASKRVAVPPAPVQSGRAKPVDEDEITDLRERHWIDGETYRDLADEFHISSRTVGKILRRHSPYTEGPQVQGEPDPKKVQNQPEDDEPESDEDREREQRHQARRDRAADAADPGLHSDGGFTVRAS